VSSGAFAALKGSGVDDDAHFSGAAHDGPIPEPSVFYGVAPPPRRFHFHPALVGLPVRTSVETGDHDGRTLLTGNACTHNYSDATEKDRRNYPAGE
jgi:hypothetical protein